jgi:hypothetical protein
MAAYASTVTNTSNGIERISRNLGVLTGTIDITNYNATTTEETNITRYFKPSAQSGLEKGILFLSTTSSEKGIVLGFNKTTGKFKAYYADYDALADGALIEVATDVDCGTFDFVAVGFLA